MRFGGAVLAVVVAVVAGRPACPREIRRVTLLVLVSRFQGFPACSRGRCCYVVVALLLRCCCVVVTSCRLLWWDLSTKVNTFSCNFVTIFQFFPQGPVGFVVP